MKTDVYQFIWTKAILFLAHSIDKALYIEELAIVEYVEGCCILKKF